MTRATCFSTRPQASRWQSCTTTRTADRTGWDSSRALLHGHRAARRDTARTSPQSSQAAAAQVAATRSPATLTEATTGRKYARLTRPPPPQPQQTIRRSTTPAPTAPERALQAALFIHVIQFLQVNF